MSALLLVAAATLMQAQPAPPAATARKAKDPNEVVCEKIEILGTRLATKRICMTRREWAEQQAVDRQSIDRTQVQRACTNEGC